MRDDRSATAGRMSARLRFVLGALIGWLVIQNGALLLIWSWPVWPTAWVVARALSKVGGLLAAPLAAAALMVGGAGWVWAAFRRSSPPRRRRLEEVRHG